MKNYAFPARRVATHSTCHSLRVACIGNGEMLIDIGLSIIVKIIITTIIMYRGGLVLCRLVSVLNLFCISFFG